MSRSRRLHLFSLLLPATLVVVSGCATRTVTAEVLPPRTSTTCSAPGVSSSALGRGLLDVDAAADHHGAYVADLRVSVFGANARVDGVNVAFTLPDDVEKATTTAAEKAAGPVPAGDIVLVGEDDDVRQAVLEGVEIVPRALTVALAEDSDLALSANDFATLQIDITPTSDDGALAPSTTSFAIDLCKGCLVAAPTAAECPNGPQRNAVCRIGQDVRLFSCAAAAPAAAP